MAWGFLTNHARVLLCISADPGIRLRDIASTLGITERSAYAIVTDLTEEGYIVKARDGRRNRYEVQHDMPISDTNRGRTVGELLDLLVEEPKRRQRTGARKSAGRKAASERRK